MPETGFMQVTKCISKLSSEALCEETTWETKIHTEDKSETDLRELHCGRLQ
jgi:hypothetical protein